MYFNLKKTIKITWTQSRNWKKCHNSKPASVFSVLSFLFSYLILFVLCLRHGFSILPRLPKIHYLNHLASNLWQFSWFYLLRARVIGLSICAWYIFFIYTTTLWYCLLAFIWEKLINHQIKEDTQSMWSKLLGTLHMITFDSCEFSPSWTLQFSKWKAESEAKAEFPKLVLSYNKIRGNSINPSTKVWHFHGAFYAGPILLITNKFWLYPNFAQS